MWKLVKVETDSEQLERKIRSDPSPEEIAELKNQWFSVEEAIEALAENGPKLAVSTFRTRAKQVNKDKDFWLLGKPQVRKVKSGGKGASSTEYNRAFIEILKTLTYSDTYRRFEEEPIVYITSDEWKRNIEEKFRGILDGYIKGPEEADSAVDELLLCVRENLVEKYYSIIAQNKLLIHQNKKLEDTKENLLSAQQGAEGRANTINEIAYFIKGNIDDSSKMLARKEVYHFKQTLKTNEKLNEIIELLKKTEEGNDRS